MFNSFLFLKYIAICLGVFLVNAIAIVPAHAHILEVGDDDLAEVAGQEGIRIDIYGQFNANAVTEVNLDSYISLGFFDATQQKHTYLVWHAFGGVMALAGLSIDAREGPADIGDFVEIGLPVMVMFKQFGFRALSAQSAIDVRPTTSYGQWLFNGGATATGSVYIWPAK